MKPDLTMYQDMIEAKLKNDAKYYRADYIEDAGFTQRVMDALPAKLQPKLNANFLPVTSRKLSPKRRFMIIVGMASFAAVMATVFLSGANLFIDASMDLATDTITPAVVAIAAVVMAMFVVVALAVVSKR